MLKDPTPTIFMPYHALDNVLLRGTRAAQPAATAITPGALYCVTNEGNKLERNSGTAWEAFDQDGMFEYFVLSPTGTVNDWAIGLGAKNAFVFWTGTAPLTVTGIAGGKEGQRLIIQNYGGGGIPLSFAHNSAASIAANRLNNWVSSGLTSTINGGGFGGTIQYLYLAGIWRLIAHEQGGWINTPFLAADWGAGFSGIGSAAILLDRYRISGNTMQWTIYINGSSPGGVGQKKVPGGFTVRGPNEYFAGPIAFTDSLGAGLGLQQNISGILNFYRITNATWAAFAAGALAVYASGTLEIT